MNLIFKRILSPLILFGYLLTTACASTQVQLQPQWDPQTKPSYEDYFDSFVFGFLKPARVDAQKACVDQKPVGILRVRSATDVALTVFTLGIYSPITIRIWCR